MRRGVLLPGSRAELVARQLQLDLPPVRVVADAQLALSHEQGSSPAARLVISQADARNDKAPAWALIRAHDLEVSAATEQADLGEPLALAEASLRMKGADADLAWFQGLVGDKLSSVAGNAHLGFDVGFKPGKPWSGAVDASLRDARVDARSWSAGGAATLHAELAAARPGAARGSLRAATVALDKVWFRGRHATASGWWARVRWDDFDWRGMPPSELKGAASIEAKDASAILLTLAGDSLLPRMSADMLESSRLRASAWLTRSKTSTRLGLQDARTGALRARGRWGTGRSGSKGAFLIEAGSVSVGLRLSGKRPHVQAMPGQQWLDQALQAEGLE
jgi:hypothetical protein